MNKKFIPSVLVGVAVSAVVLTGCNEPSDGFKDRCKDAGGTIERENDFKTLGMAPMAFSKPNPPAPKPAAPAPKAPKPAAPKPAAPKPAAPKQVIPKTPKNVTPGRPNPPQTPTATMTPDSNGFAMGKKSRKPKKTDDNDFLCVKNGEVLFEEDE